LACSRDTMKPKSTKHLQVAVSILMLSILAASCFLLISGYLAEQSQIKACLQRKAAGIYSGGGHGGWGLGGCNSDCSSCDWLDLDFTLGIAMFAALISPAALLLSSWNPKRIFSWIAVVLFLSVSLSVLGFLTYDLIVDYEPIKVGIIALIAAFIFPIYYFLLKVDSLRWLKISKHHET